MKQRSPSWQRVLYVTSEVYGSSQGCVIPSSSEESRSGFASEEEAKARSLAAARDDRPTIRRRLPTLRITISFLLFASPGPLGGMIAAPAGQRLVRAAQNEAMNFNLEGTISKLDAGKLTISTEDNIIFHVRYNDKTEIKHEDGSAGTAKDLRVGVKVRVEGDLTESGETVAKKIVIEKKASSESREGAEFAGPELSIRLLGSTLG